MHRQYLTKNVSDMKNKRIMTKQPTHTSSTAHTAKQANKTISDPSNKIASITLLAALRGRILTRRTGNHCMEKASIKGGS